MTRPTGLSYEIDQPILPDPAKVEAHPLQMVPGFAVRPRIKVAFRAAGPIHQTQGQYQRMCGPPYSDDVDIVSLNIPRF
jgi:hypothetical protein